MMHHLIGWQASLHAQYALGKLGGAVLQGGHVQQGEGRLRPGEGGFSPLAAACPHQQPQLNLQARQQLL